jgi:serine/threonine protein phosphatase 1
VWYLDQGGGFEGKLSLMDIDTHEFWQSDKVVNLYPGFHGR